jgi:hypothetical protein
MKELETVTKILEEFITTHGRCAYMGVKYIDTDLFPMLSEKIAVVLKIKEWRKVCAVMDSFTQSRPLYGDNNIVLSEQIIKECNG